VDEGGKGQVKEARVSSWNELNEQLYADAWREDIARFRPSCAYRGMGRSDHDLCTSLARLRGTSRELEYSMLRAFRKYASNESVPGDSVWNWLALAQHHGLPTRLLDWTYSPYVAMHFATAHEDLFDVDGVIWCFDYVRSNDLLPDQLKVILSEEDSDVFTAEMLSRAASTLEEFDSLSDREFVGFFEPPSFDARIVNQYALFSLLSSPDFDLDQWLAEHPTVIRKIVIPTQLKPEVRDKLDQANITERVLYPGLDGLSLWLKRYYRPRTA